MPPSSLRVHREFTRTYRSHLQSRRVYQARKLRTEAACLPLISNLSYTSTLKIGTIRSYETSVGFHRTTRPYNAEDRTFHNHRRENLTTVTHYTFQHDYTSICEIQSSHCGEYEDYCLLGCDTVYSGRNGQRVRMNLLPLPSG
jgi:hypothetical protein